MTAKPTVAIIGLGLIGGSLGQALRRSKRYRVIGFSRRPVTLRNAKRLGAVDQTFTRLDDLHSAQIVVLATPVDRIIPTVKKILPHLRPGTYLTDVGSVKGTLVPSIFRLLKGRSIHWVGGHPLAGSHKTGVKAARSDLFQKATCVLVPATKASLKPILALWNAVGARPLILSARDHDAAVAITSHLPHVLAHALVQLVAAHPDQVLLKKMVAGSFRDVTRIASSDPELWAEIFRANAPQLRRAIQLFRRQLVRLEQTLERPSLRPLLKRSQQFRSPLFHGI
ncbi:MAG: prephenate dehydrogenase/arogenate dehydrogenase family protein [Elusimicrobiota bacterium]|jgi:prephenate dehydrogenase